MIGSWLPVPPFFTDFSGVLRSIELQMLFFFSPLLALPMYTSHVIGLGPLLRYFNELLFTY